MSKVCSTRESHGNALHRNQPFLQCARVAEGRYSWQAPGLSAEVCPAAHQRPSPQYPAVWRVHLFVGPCPRRLRTTRCDIFQSSFC